MDQVQLSQPKLRSSVEVAFADVEVTLRQGECTCELNYPQEARASIDNLFRTLRQGGRSVAELEALHPELDGVALILSTLDAARLLTESYFPAAVSTMTGTQLHREVRRICNRMTDRLATSRFHDALASGTANCRQMVGYALEYYWLVRAAPALIAPSLATAPSLPRRRLLQNFLASELNHDAYLGRALAAVGIDIDGLALLQPLPTTFSVCASLGVYAHQHPMSFYASLFLFEEPRAPFVLAFEQRCRDLGLPEAFAEPFRWHAELNGDAKHGEISAELLGTIPLVTLEEQVVVKRNVSVLLETLLRQEHEVLDYYGDEDRPSPRLFV